VSVLGIDLGKKRIGLAISDPSERVALPAGMIESRGRSADLAAIGTLARERGIAQIVVGLPLHMDGRAGPEAQAARAFAKALETQCGIPVDVLDERWSSVAAERTLRETGQSRRKRKTGEADTLAATLLLRTFLERRANERGRSS
jgi:putative Holliday junction resolvase